MKKTVAKIVVCGLLLVGVCAASASNEERKSEILKVLRNYETAYNAGDAKAVSELYTEDGVLLPPGQPVKGRAALAEYWKTHMGKGLKLVLTEFEINGKAGWAAGTWSLPGAGGNFLIALRFERGQWRLAADTYNQPSKP